MAIYREGDVATGLVTGVEKYGIFVSLDDGYTGLIHISEVSNLYVNDINKYAKVGEKINFRILKIDADKKMILSIKRYNDSFKESGLGFKPLLEKLPYWIEKKSGIN